MNTKILLVPAIGVALVSGCSGPLDKRWDDPVYRSLKEQYTDSDRQSADALDSGQSTEVFGLDSLDLLSLEDAIRLAIYNHPQLRSAGYRIDATSGRVVQAGLYPNPEVSIEAEALGSNAGSGGETAFVLQQEIVLGGKLDRARDLAESNRLIARGEFVAQEFRVAAGVSRAYYAVVSSEERLSQREKLAELATKLLDAATARLQAGSATISDRLRAEVVFEQAQIELDEARFESVATRRGLASAIGIVGQVDLMLGTPIDRLPEMLSLDAILLSTLETSSRMSLARIDIVRAQQSHRLAKSQSVPNLVVSIGPRYSDVDHESTIDAGLSIQIPLFDQNQGEIQAALAERLSASAQLRSVQLDLLAEVADAWSVYQSSLSAATRYQIHLLPKAQQTLDLTRQAYQSGKADFLRLLDAQQVVIVSNIAYIDTMQRLHNAATLLNELSHIQAPWREDRHVNSLQSETNQ